MRRNFKLLLATVAILAVLCSGALAGEVKKLSALSGQEEQHKWTDGNTYVVDADLKISERITVTGSVTLMLTDGFTLSADQGINVSGDNGLTITTPNAPGGTGRLIANGSGNNAAIGGNKAESGGTITINGGIVTASFVDDVFNMGHGAGIGSGGGLTVRGVPVTGGTITITGGTVKASSVNGAGIGSGAPISSYDPALLISSGTIIITGGIVTAESTYGDGIGLPCDWGQDASGSTRLGSLSSDPNSSAWINAANAGVGNPRYGVGVNSDGFNGVIFGSALHKFSGDSGNGKVYGTASVSGDVAIPSGKTLEIPDGAKLTIRNGATLDASDGTLDNKGTLVNDGVLKLASGTDIASLKLGGSGTVEVDGVKHSNSGYEYRTITVTPVTPGSNGTASADLTEAASGDVVNLTATPDVGYVFDEWVTVPASLVITGREHASFTMPDEPVEVKATFKPLPPGEYAIIVDNDGHGTGTADPSVASKDIIVTLTPSPDPGYEFDAWVAVSPTSLDISNDKFTMPNEDVTVKATFKALPPTPTPPPALTPDPPPAPTPSYTTGKYTGAIDTSKTDGLWDARAGGDMTIHIDVSFDQFTGSVSLDRVLLTMDTTISHDFGAREGSTIVTIWEKTLKEHITTDGDHTAEVGFKDGTAIHKFVVRGTGETPPQKQSTSGGACATGAAVVVGLIGLAAIKRRKK